MKKPPCKNLRRVAFRRLGLGRQIRDGTTETQRVPGVPPTSTGHSGILVGMEAVGGQ